MLHSFFCILEIYLCIHAIGVPEGVTLLEFEGAHPEEEQEQPEETECCMAKEFPKKSYPSAPITAPLPF
jgi:hypothetical protein